MCDRQYLIELKDGCKARNIIKRYIVPNLISGYTIGKIKMRKILMDAGFEVKMTRYGMIVYGGM